MADAYALLVEGFGQELGRLLETYELDRLLKNLPEDQAMTYGREAARSAMAPLIWRAAAGDVLETSAVRELLGVSRQALADRVDRGTLLGLPAERTTLYPTWQFDGTAVRDVVPDVVGAFRARLGESWDPLMVASWARTPQRELEDETPADWLIQGRDEQRVLLAAKRAAEALSR